MGDHANRFFLSYLRFVFASHFVVVYKSAPNGCIKEIKDILRIKLQAQLHLFFSDFGNRYCFGMEYNDILKYLHDRFDVKHIFVDTNLVHHSLNHSKWKTIVIHSFLYPHTIHQEPKTVVD